MGWPENVFLVLAIEFLALGGVGLGAAALGLGKWPGRRVAVFALGGLVGLGLSVASAYTYAVIEGQQAAGGPGPTRDQVVAARAMSPQQRLAMINAMVGRLAARLRDNPNDLAGWLRLARAYAVMGRRADALKAYRAAKRHFPSEGARIDRLMRAVTTGR